MMHKVTNIFLIKMTKEFITGYKPLRIKTQDSDDLKIFSSHFQDALCPIVSMVHEKKTFTLLANRFCWEIEKKDNSHYYRVHSGICVRYVENISHKGLNLGERIFNLLTIQLEDANHLRLVFSNDYELRIQILKLEIYANDLHSPWPTTRRPIHLHEHLEVA